MSTHVNNTNMSSLAPETDTTANSVFPKHIPHDILVQIGETKFALHKMMLVAKSNYIRRLILESEEPDLEKIDLLNIPGGADIFKEVAKFCYGVAFDITVYNVAALHCAAEYLEMTDGCCDGNLASRTYGFLTQVALTSFSGAITVLNSCENLLPVAQELNIVNPCVEVICTKVCEEAIFPCCSPPYWWAEELSIVNVTFFRRIIDSMKSRGAKAFTIASAITTYAKRSLPELTVTGVKSPRSDDDSVSRIKQREVLDSIVDLLPVGTQHAFFSIDFICCLLRTAIFLKNNDDCKKKLEKWISGILEHLTVEDLLLLSYTFHGARLGDMASVRRIVIGFVEKEKSHVSVFNSGEYNQAPSPAMLRVAKTIDAFLREIARDTELSILNFNEIANLVPKNVRKVDDELYRAIDIYLEAHPKLDEIEREKVCNAMDPLKLSFEARVHASQNKKLPLQIVLYTLYYDQLQVRSGQSTPCAQSMRLQVHTDLALAIENKNLRSELLCMKKYIADMEKKNVETTSTKMKNMKKPSFFTSVSKTLGKLNPFKQGSKDTSNIDDDTSSNKPRRRRFSIS